MEYIGGKIAEVRRDDHTYKLVRYINPKQQDVFQYHHNITKYSILRDVFPWARWFRAGMIILYKDEQDIHLLRVCQNETAFRLEDNSIEFHPPRYGLPKGSISPGDISAMETARREVQEETGIDPAEYGDRVWCPPTTIIAPFPQKNIEEVHIWIPVIFYVKPSVRICNKEIIKYEWRNIKEYRSIYPNASYTNAPPIIALLNNIDFTSV